MLAPHLAAACAMTSALVCLIGCSSHAPTYPRPSTTSVADGGTPSAGGSTSEGSGPLRIDRSIKASEPRAYAHFGASVTLSADGKTLAAVADHERNATTPGISTGRVAVYSRASGSWQEEADLTQAELDANTEVAALSADGNTLAVGAPASDGGAVYVLSRSGGAWTKGDTLRMRGTGLAERFGIGVALSGDGNVVAIAARSDSSDGSGSLDASGTGASVYVFEREGGAWEPRAFLRPFTSKLAASSAIAIARDGKSIAIAGTGASDPSVVVFVKRGATWENTHAWDGVAGGVALSADGSVLAIGAPKEAGTRGNPGAAHVLVRDGDRWTLRSTLTASNARANANFGARVALSDDGSALVVAAPQDNSAGVGVDGDEGEPTFATPAGYATGAVYLFARGADETKWTQEAFVKSPAAHDGCRAGQDACFEREFGAAVACSASGKTIAVGDPRDSSPSKGVVEKQDVPVDGSAAYSGAVHVFVH